MKIIILTGSELRHKYFISVLEKNKKIKVIKVICESDSKSLKNRNLKNKNISKLEITHENSRFKSEKKYFLKKKINIKNNKIINIKKGHINNTKIINMAKKLSPDLIICYGSSIISSKFIKIFEHKFLNIHLGLSPYYRGAGTNIWPLINNEPEYVGVTFMNINEGIDTGEVLHQIQARIFKNDTPHDIGNRLIKDMSKITCSIILNFKRLKKMKQIVSKKQLYYVQKDFDKVACELLYKNFNNNFLIKYLNRIKKSK
ncbi:formyltransferase family protein, partial [Alphaproteobacteria bacterium]|nr:formyltransferase family protein [Alphaproteobacteria bacterium]